MSKKEYIFDEDYGFRKSRSLFVTILLFFVKTVLSSLLMAVLYYFVVAAFVSTDSEKRLQNENRMYGRLYPEMKSREHLLRTSVLGLKLRDEEIYQAVFHASVPSLSDLTLPLPEDDEELLDQDIFNYAAAHLAKTENAARRVEDNFRKVFERCAQPGFAIPPMNLPLEDFETSRAGASVGQKISPFYKVSTFHGGLDLVAPSGTPVLAAGAGEVRKVVRSSQGQGNTVTIAHPGGYVTKYAHLSEIRVAAGKKVRRGDCIGYVGVSGKTFAPHLHYEVTRDTVVLDPVHFSFGSLTPQQYAELMAVSTAAAQSLD